MKWLQQFELILLDFDGLLVNTEQLHFEAYATLCSEQGYALPWDFDQFCAIAHTSSGGLREAIYAQFPDLSAKRLSWEMLYARKKQIYSELLRADRLSFLPGVEALLKELSTRGLKRCVVTNSTADQARRIKQILPLLTTIPVWITREQYEESKPAPDAYLKALELLADPGDRIIGFEDTLRGIQSLQAVSALPVLVCPKNHPQLQSGSLKEVIHFSSFEEIPSVYQFHS